MMLRFVGEIPDKCYVAVSGGVDSMTVLDFLTRNRRRDIVVLHFNHGTTFGDEAERFVVTYCRARNIPCIVGHARTVGSTEKEWRDERYSFFDEYTDRPIIMCHSLDDQVETWLFYSMRGCPHLIPYRRDNVIRPFILTKREDMLDWCERKAVPFLRDPANKDVRHARSRIRHNILPQVLEINPGIHTTIANKIKSLYK